MNLASEAEPSIVVCPKCPGRFVASIPVIEDRHVLCRFDHGSKAGEEDVRGGPDQVVGVHGD